MFKLGDRVISKKTGFPVTGRVVGFLDARAYLYQMQWIMRNNDFKMKRWDELYPDWQDKLIVYVYLDQPTKPVTEEEFRKTNDNPNMIYSNVREQILISYPLDDLELFQEESIEV